MQILTVLILGAALLAIVLGPKFLAMGRADEERQEREQRLRADLRQRNLAYYNERKGTGGRCES